MRKPRASRRVFDPPVAVSPTGDGLDAFGAEDAASFEARVPVEPPRPRPLPAAGTTAPPPSAAAPTPSVTLTAPSGAMPAPSVIVPIDSDGGLESFWSEEEVRPGFDAAPPTSRAEIAGDPGETVLAHDGGAASADSSRADTAVYDLPASEGETYGEHAYTPQTSDDHAYAGHPYGEPAGDARTVGVSYEPATYEELEAAATGRPIDGELAAERFSEERAWWQPDPVPPPIVRPRYASLALGAVGFVVGAGLVVLALSRLEREPQAPVAEEAAATTSPLAPATLPEVEASPAVVSTTGQNPAPPTRTAMPAEPALRTEAVAARTPAAPLTVAPPSAAAPSVAPAARQSAPATARADGRVAAEPVAVAPTQAPPTPDLRTPEPRAPEMVASAVPVTRSIVVQPEPPPAAVPVPTPARPAAVEPAAEPVRPTPAPAPVAEPPAPPRAAAVETSAAAAPASSAPSSPASVRPANDELAIRRTLDGYRAAYNQLSASSAKAVWPSVDVVTLTKAFDQLESQSIEFSNCSVSVGGDSARAVCGGSAAFVPKVGNRTSRRDAREWRFSLQRTGERWVISRMEMR